MSNNTSCPRSFSNNFSIVCDFNDHGGQEGPYTFVASFVSAVFIAIFSPVAVTGNELILAAIWKRHFHERLFILFLVDYCSLICAPGSSFNPSMLQAFCFTP